jgi:serine/threonine-protein kinase
VGRYLVYRAIASGGMATVHYGALRGEAGFSRVVAIKRLRADRKGASLVASLVDEARLLSRIQHPNVVPTLDVVSHEGEILVVLEYVAGESLSRILKLLDEREQRVPVRHATTIMASVLHGLHAAHDAKSVQGVALGIVHRDVSPQNIILGADGLARVLDFGIAKASERLTESVAGQVKGKMSYASPEQLRGKTDRRTDIYAASVVLWEMLAGQRLFWGKNGVEVINQVLTMEVPAPSRYAPEVPGALDALVLKGLARDPRQRFASAEEFALALEEAFGVATPSQLGTWLKELAGATLAERAHYVQELERDAVAGGSAPPLLPSPSSPPEPRLEEPRTGRLTVSTDALESSLPVLVDSDATAVDDHDLRTTARDFPAVTRGATPRSSEVWDQGTVTGMVTPEAARPPRRRRRWLWLAPACALFAGLALRWFVVDEPAPATPVGMPSPAALPLAPPEPSETRTGEQASAAPPEASQAPSAPAASSIPRLAGSGPRASTLPARSAPSAARTPPADGCDPPYTVDARGVRHLKPHCL